MLILLVILILPFYDDAIDYWRKKVKAYGY